MAEQLVVISTGSFSSKYKILSHENKTFMIPASLPPSIHLCLSPSSYPTPLYLFILFIQYIHIEWLQ